MTPEELRIRHIEQITADLKAYWENHPHLRLGQILSNFSDVMEVSDIYYINDLDLQRTINRHNPH